MRKLLLVGALALSAGLFSDASRADDTGLADDTRFYARAGVSRTDLTNLMFYDGESDTSLGITLGWRFLPWLSVEAGYSDLGDFKYNCRAEACPFVVLPPFEIDGVELGLAARVPFGESGLFGQARVGVLRWDDGPSNSETDPYYGIGVGYAFNERFNLSLNFDRYDLGNVNVNRLGLGFEVAW